MNFYVYLRSDTPDGARLLLTYPTDDILVAVFDEEADALRYGLHNPDTTPRRFWERASYVGRAMRRYGIDEGEAWARCYRVEAMT